ncbi:family 78 glycoside hydrolase catalytic domain [Nonomuraea sp. NPDC026600]|uniref:family 78 glycoside hydrolase catalytic domain n=1 Tax=Nonomuraea sp. NPDC026600 TaxID=3155363 RepID=UPI0033DA613E
MNSAVPAPRDLRVNGRVSPLGIETRPRFSWDPQVRVQSAHEIEVGTAPGAGDVWTTGRVTGGDSVAIPYEGPALRSATVYHWRVRVWDDSGAVLAWSDWSRWETGLLDAEDWESARWIGGRQPQDHDWSDFEAAIDFRGGDDPVAGLTFLFRAEPIGKTWGEALSWTLGLAPRLDSAMAAAAAQGTKELYVDNTAGLSAGDRIFIGTGPDRVDTEVTSVGVTRVATQVRLTFGPGLAFTATQPGIHPGEPLRVGEEDVEIRSVTHAHGGTIISFEPAVPAPAGTPIDRSATPTIIADPLHRDVRAGEPASGTTRMRLAMATQHYAGNTGVPGGEPTVEWGRNYYDPQSAVNPVESGTRTIDLSDVDIPPACGLGPDTWTKEHRLSVTASGNVIETRVNRHLVDRRELHGDEVRGHGSIGFGRGSSALIRSVIVRSPRQRELVLDLTRGANPFEGGLPSLSGLAIADTNAMLPIANPAPLVRTTVRIPDVPLTRARLYVTAAGQHEFTIGGRPLTVPDLTGTTDRAVPRLLPDHTSFDRTVLYDTFDVTDLIPRGAEIVLAAELGRGWYGVVTPTEWYWNLANYHGAPRLLAKLELDFADGTRKVVVTGPDWETIDGPTRLDSVYSGEKYDARVAEQLRDWRLGRDHGRWSPATVMARPGSAPEGGHHGPLPPVSEPPGFVAARLRAHENEPVVVLETREPTDIFETAPGSGVWVVDFGQILTGFPSLGLRDVLAEAAGATIRFRGGNAVQGSGTADDPWSVEHENSFHDADLQTDYYTLGASPEQAWTPRLTHWGLRYLEVRNFGLAVPDAGPAEVAAAFRVEVARSGFPRNGSFRSDSPLLNRIRDNLEWAEQNNLIHKPTDTPSREKNGWSGDAMASSESQLLTWGTVPLFTKYLRDFPDAMADSGQLPMILPAVRGGYGYDRTPGWNACWSAVPAWDAALLVIPWELYLYSGDPSILAELWPTQLRLLDYYATLFLAEHEFVFEAALGEYSAAGDAGSNAVISLQFYVHFADYLHRVGKMLGEPAAEDCLRLAGDLRRAFVRRYWDPDARHFVGGQLESENVMALEFDLVPGTDLPADDPRHLAEGGTLAENRRSVAEAVAASIRDAGHHFQSGVFGARYLFNVLEEFGYTDLLMRTVTVREAPGFADQIAHGATSLWEAWTGGSLNHHYRSNVATWFYQELAGITPTSPGYATVRVRPRIPMGDDYSRTVPTSPEDPAETGRLDFVAAELRTPRGVVSSEWRRGDEERVALAVTVPSNTVAEVWCPRAGEPVAMPQDGVFVGDREFGGMKYSVFRVGRGTHRFAGRLA